MLTPMEIQNKKFEKAVMGGYNKEDVNDFISFILEDYEALYKQSIEYEEKIKGLNSQIESYKNMDETMKNTLIVAQGAAETVQKNAIEKADLIVREAKEQAQKIIEDAKKDSQDAISELSKIKHEMDIFKCQAISMLNAQIENLKKYESLND